MQPDNPVVKVLVLDPNPTKRSEQPVVPIVAKDITKTKMYRTRAKLVLAVNFLRLLVILDAKNVLLVCIQEERLDQLIASVAKLVCIKIKKAKHLVRNVQKDKTQKEEVSKRVVMIVIKVILHQLLHILDVKPVQVDGARVQKKDIIAKDV